jgi:hypothetical protein
VENLHNGRSAYAICADVGSKDKIGEGSIKLAKLLDIPSSPKKGGIADSIFYTVYPGSGNGKPQTIHLIDSIGRAEDSVRN